MHVVSQQLRLDASEFVEVLMTVPHILQYIVSDLSTLLSFLPSEWYEGGQQNNNPLDNLP